MTVVCINDKWTRDPQCEGKPFPSIGDKDTVVDIIEKYGNTYYLLQRFGNEQGFKTSHFVDLPDDTADEMADAEKEAIVNLETVPA